MTISLKKLMIVVIKIALSSNTKNYQNYSQAYLHLSLFDCMLAPESIPTNNPPTVSHNFKDCYMHVAIMCLYKKADDIVDLKYCVTGRAIYTATPGKK